MSRVAGIVLCGGHSRRMGRPKAWLPIGDETFLQRIVRVVGEAVDEVIVVADEGQELPPLPPHVRRVNDLIPDRGPLGGFATGLAAVGSGCDAVYLAACDMPLLTSDFVRAVLDTLWMSPDCDAALVCIKDIYPMGSAYRTSVRGEVDRRVADGLLRMMEFIGAIRGVAHRIERNEFNFIRGVNTPEEYERLIRNPVSS